MTYGFSNNPSPAPTAMAWDIAAGLVMLFSRFLPIIAPVAMAAYLGAKKPSPAGLGTLRDDTVTFGVLLLGHDPHRRRPAVPAGRRARPAGGAPGADPVRRLSCESP